MLATAEYRERLAEAIFLGTIIYLAEEEGEQSGACKQSYRQGLSRAAPALLLVCPSFFHFSL